MRKAEKMVEKALSYFTGAKEEVEKANNHLRKGVEKDTENVKQLQAELDEARRKIIETEINREDKLVAIEENEGLISELDKFTRGAR